MPFSQTPLLLPTDSLLLYGDTGSGKTPQVGELAEHVALSTGKQTLLYRYDRGGVETIRPLLNLGVVVEENLLPHPDPFVAINAAIQGERWVGGKWVKADLSKFGLLAYESLSTMAETIRLAMTKENAEGRSVGGKASFVLKRPGFNVSSNTMVDYAVVQSFLTEKTWQSQMLGLPTIWTSHVQRGQDEENNAPIVGPTVAGKALTAVVPRWFTYTFRLDAIPVANGRARHLLYIEEHTDTGLKGFANDRIPLGANLDGFKSMIEPASIVVAMKQIRAAQASAEANTAARLKSAGISFV